MEDLSNQVKGGKEVTNNGSDEAVNLVSESGAENKKDFDGIAKIAKKIVSTAIESDEISNEEMQKADILQNLKYSDGKRRDEVDEIEAKEKLMGVDVISPFGTGNPKVFKRKLESMSLVEKATLAEKTATRVFADQQTQDEALIKAFHEWRGGNWGSTGTHTYVKAKVLASDSIEDFEEKVKRKTLSELQEMAMKLGFTPSFDRVRLVAALKQEYLKRG